MTLYALTPEWQKIAAGVFREDPQFERAFIYAFSMKFKMVNW